MENLNTSPNEKKETLSGKLANLLGARAVQTTELEDAPEEYRDIKFWAREYRDIELSFAKKEYTDISEEELTKWEKDAKYYFDQMEKAATKEDGLDRYTRDRAEKIKSVKPYETIEAISGKFYDERRDCLMDAIPENETADMEAAQKFPELVMEHLSKQYDYETRSFDPAAYQAQRARAHNDMIRGLNTLNKLAEKYGTDRFTFRDFETNDYRYIRDLDWSGDTDARTDYDRTIVEEYARQAFSREFSQAEEDVRRLSA